ncbi:MAG: glycosyltransferase [Desulfobulbus sp.]|nr:glycosyltransferase [Desulfobulbus sp.]
MIKIAFVIDTIESPTAGTEKQLLLLIDNLDRTRFEPYLCVLRSSKWLKSEFSGCRSTDIGFYSFKSLISWYRLLIFSNFLKKEKIDIVQTYFNDGNKVGILAAKLSGIKSIISTRRNQGYWHRRGDLFVLKIINNFVTKFLANSKSTATWLEETEGVNKNKIVVIYNALNYHFFYKSTEEQRIAFREQLNFSKDAILIGLVANLRPVKSIDVFIKAVNIVVQSYPQVGFVIVGEGSERADLEQLCGSLNLTESMRFLGRRLDVPEILSCLDVGVLTSSSESFSNAIIEYMAAGLAVVCSDVGGAREAVEDGVTGFVVKPDNCQQIAEKIKQLIVKNRFVDMGKGGRKNAVQNFSLEKIVTQHDRFYEQLL